MNKLERRALEAVELRAEPPGNDDTMPALVGHAAVFDRLSEDLGGFRERIAPGAFAATLAEDDEGLSVRIEPPETSYARDLVASVERGDISGMSIGFRTITDEWHLEDGEPVRTLKAVRLYDVSPVTFPAYADTDVALRALSAFCDTLKPPLPWRRQLAGRRLQLIEQT